MSVSVNCWKPSAVTVILYLPGGKTRRRYSPPGSADLVSLVKFVSTFVATTRAPGTTACDTSCTIPITEPDAVCAQAAFKHNSAESATKSILANQTYRSI